MRKRQIRAPPSNDIEYSTDGRPIIKVPWTLFEWFLFVGSAGLVLTCAIYVGVVYQNLPAQIPDHWNENGEVDNYGNKSVLAIFPVLSFSLFVLLNLAARCPYSYRYSSIEINEINCYQVYPLARSIIRYIGFVLTILLLALSIVTYSAASSGKDNSGSMLGVILGGVGGLLFGVIILGMKLKSFAS